MQFNQDFKKVLDKEKEVHQTTYEDYVNKLTEIARKQAVIPARSNIVHYGKAPNKIRVK